MKINEILIPSEGEFVPVFFRPFPKFFEIGFYRIEYRLGLVSQFAGKKRAFDREFRKFLRFRSGIRDERHFPLDIGNRVPRFEFRLLHGRTRLFEIFPDETEQDVVRDSGVVGPPFAAFAQFQIRQRGLEIRGSP